MIVDDLPTGSVFFFISTLFISYFFQFVGFLLTYLLHSSHASKYGSRAGLGLTLIQYGFYSRREQLEEAGDGDSRTYWNATTGMPVIVADPNSDLGAPYNSTTDSIPFYEFGVSSRDWLAFLLMTLGTFNLRNRCLPAMFISLVPRLVSSVIVPCRFLSCQTLGDINSSCKSATTHTGRTRVRFAISPSSCAGLWCLRYRSGDRDSKT